VSMQLRVVHTTGFEYDGAVAASYNEARLTPVTAAGQIVVHSRLDITPAPWIHNYRDYFGTQVTAFEVLDPHSSLTVRSVATVHTQRPPLPAPVLTWAELAQPTEQDAHCEYLALPELVAPPEELAAEAREIAARAERPGDAAREVCELVHATMEYRRGSTDVQTSAAEAWRQKAGVCQDIAHVVVGTLRSLGIPARYVSGYLHPGRDPEPGQTVKGESHAWVEWWDEWWRGYDPTNDEPISDRHVVIAAGRDYGDVRPLKGIYSGGGTSSMFVDVEVTRLG